MRGHYYGGYVEYKQRRRQSLLRSQKEYRDTVQEFITMAEEQAHALGSIRPVEYWGMQPYAKEMFDHIADQRMLYRAWTSLKGLTHGIDGVRPEDIGRFVVYREWLETCRLLSPHAPGYADTVFPELDDFGLYVFHCMIDPERRYATKQIEFDWNTDEETDNIESRQRNYTEFRMALDTLGAVRGGALALLPEAQRNLTIRKIESYMPGKTRRSNTPMRLALPGVGGLDSEEQERYRDFLRRVGLGEEPVAELGKVFADGIGRLLELEHHGRAKSFITEITPLRYMMDYHCAKDEYEQERARNAMRKAVDWAAMRWISRLVEKIKTNDKGYRPQPLRRVNTPKSDGGVRTLSLPTATDRIVSKSAVLVVQPVMEGVFLPSSVGCRNEKDRFDALATIADRYLGSPSKIIIVADIQKAFDNVPHDRLMGVVEKYVPNKDVRSLLERFIRRPGFEAGIGLAQGDPLSPLFLNMLLHDYLDVPIDGYIQEHGLTYFRYVDDLSVFGLSSRTHGEEVIARVGELLHHVGLSLHTKAPKTQIVDLAHESAEYRVDPDTVEEGEIDRYLGLCLRGGINGELEFFLPSSWEERIREMYVRAEEKITMGGYAGKNSAYIHIFHATESWIWAFAPALQHEDKNKITKRIVEICKDASRHPIGDPEELHEAWDGAQEWWTRKCSEV